MRGPGPRGYIWDAPPGLNKRIRDQDEKIEQLQKQVDRLTKLVDELKPFWDEK